VRERERERETEVCKVIWVSSKRLRTSDGRQRWNESEWARNDEREGCKGEAGRYTPCRQAWPGGPGQRARPSWSWGHADSSGRRGPDGIGGNV